MCYSKLMDSDKQRLAAAWINIRDPKLAMSKARGSPTRPRPVAQLSTKTSQVNCPTASLDFQPNKIITDASFKTSITRLSRTYSARSASDKHRLATSFANISIPADLKLVMSNVSFVLPTPTLPVLPLTPLQTNWAKAALDFKPSGKPVSAASFRTSIQRLLKDDSGSTTGNKRKAPATEDHHPSAKSNKKKTKTSRAVSEEKENATRPASTENPGDLPVSPSRPVKEEEEEEEFDYNPYGYNEMADEEKDLSFLL
jgi:hypothetical protein